MSKSVMPQTPFTAGRAKNRRLYLYDAAGNPICSGFSSIAMPEKVAARIALACNNTYGAGIDPAGVRDMLKTLQQIENVHYGWTEAHQLEMIKEWAKAAIEKAKL